MQKAEQDDAEWVDEQIKPEPKLQKLSSQENGEGASGGGFKDSIASEQQIEPAQQVQGARPKTNGTQNVGEGLTDDDVASEEQIEPKQKRQKMNGKTDGLDISSEAVADDVASREPRQKRQKLNSAAVERDAFGRRPEDSVAPQL